MTFLWTSTTDSLQRRIKDHYYHRKLFLKFGNDIICFKRKIWKTIKAPVFRNPLHRSSLTTGEILKWKVSYQTFWSKTSFFGWSENPKKISSKIWEGQNSQWRHSYFFFFKAAKQTESKVFFINLSELCGKSPLHVTFKMKWISCST